MTLARRTFRGVLWNFADQFGRHGINVLVTLLLAHLLVPEDFGLVAIMSALLVIANSFMESGFKQALIRMETVEQLDYNTAFFSNLALGLLAFIIIAITAPMVAAFYADPRLVDLIRAGGITILLNAFYVVQSAILSRDLDFRALLVTSVPSILLAGIAAIVLAWAGAGVWALVAQIILYALFTAIIVWRITPWRPTLEISGSSFRKMFGFGSRLFAARMIDTVCKNLYVIVLAKVFATSIAGYYFFAEKIKDIVVRQLVTSVQTVTYPALSTLQNDNALLKDGYRKVILATTFILFPSMALLAALAGPLFSVLLPEKWLPATPYLQLLCIAGMMVPLNSLNTNILQVKGRANLLLMLEIVKKTTLVLVLIYSLEYGIMGVLIGRIATSVLNYLPNSYFTGKLINYPANEQLSDFMPAFLLAGIVGVITYIGVTVLDWSALVELCVLGALGVLIYIGAAHIFRLRALALVVGIVRKQGYRTGWLG